MPLLAAIAAFCVGGSLAFGMNWIALFRFRSVETAHWTERARRLYPIRKSAALNILLIPVICALIQSMIFPRSEMAWVAGLVGTSAWLGAIAGTYPFDRKIFPEFSFKEWLRLVCGTWVLRFGVIGVLVLGGSIMPEEFGWPLVAIACAVLGFQVALHFGIWLWLAKICRLLVRADNTEPLASIVRRTAERMHVPYRAVWILRSPQGYAAAFPTTGDLIFSEGMIASHPEEETAAICAHELAHLSEPRRTVYARVIGAMSLCPLIFIRPMVHAFDFGGIAMLVVPIAVSTVFVRRLGRTMEVRADAMADKNAMEAGVYARALERLYRTNQMPAVMPGKRQLHPHLYDRLLSAGVTPDYPRPKAPARLYWTTGFMYLVLVVLIILRDAAIQPHPLRRRGKPWGTPCRPCVKQFSFRSR